MPAFKPFNGLRYNRERVDLSDVVAPPYDMLDAHAERKLAARSPYHAVHLDLSSSEGDDAKVAEAARRLQDWIASGVLVTDDDPAFYAYRMGWHDPAGVPRQAVGVLGALELDPEKGTPVLPHERTHGKTTAERLTLLRATRANLSPIWTLSLAKGLSMLAEVEGPPVARYTDPDGVHHRLWRVTEQGRMNAIADAVASAPVVIADGHHRYQTALDYRDEVHAAGGTASGDENFTMAYVAELAEDQLEVRPIHRLVRRVAADVDLLQVLGRHFRLEPNDSDDAGLMGRMVDEGGLGLLLPGRSWLLRPDYRVDAERAGPDEAVDAELLAPVLASLSPGDVAYEPDAAQVRSAVDAGDAEAGFLLRPVTMGQIADVAHRDRRLPQKTTLFWPKLRTGLVFRRLAP